MNHNPIFVKLKIRAAELGISVKALGSVYVAEQLALYIAESEDTKDFLLCNFFSIGTDSVKGNGRITLIYRIEDTGYRELAELTYALKRTLKGYDKPVVWTWRSEKSGREFQFHFDCGIGNMHIPVDMILMPTLGKVTYRTYHIRLLLENSQEKDIKILPADHSVVEYTFEIMDRLIFLDDMNLFLEYYILLSECDLTGSDISRKFKAAAATRGKEIRPRELELLKNLRTDRQMRNKWRAFSKQTGRTDLTWEEVFDRIMKFLAPIWNALSEDDFFLGDWMCEIGRFLD